MSYTAVWAASTFGLGPSAVGTFFVVSGLAGAIGNPLIGWLSDRLGRRRPFIVGQLAVTALALAGYTQPIGYGLALGLVALSGFGVMGLALSTVADVARARAELAPGVLARVLATERTAWAMGIIVGPAFAAAIVTATADDLRPVFAGAAVLQIAAARCAWTVAEPARRPAGGDREGTRGPSGGRALALGLLVVGLVFLALPAQTRNMYLPLVITQVLGQPFGAVGPAFTLNAITAVLAMPHMGTLSSRIGAPRVLYLAAVTGLVYCSLQGLAPAYPYTLAIQCLIGITIALWSTSALIYLQQLLPDRAGVAGGLYLTVQGITPIVGGLALGPIAEWYGVAAPFTASAALLGLATALIAAANRRLALGHPRRLAAL